MKPSPSLPPVSPTTWADHTTDAKEAFARAFAVHVGVDCGKSFHKIVARGPDGRRGAAQKVTVNRVGFDGADAFLTQTYPGIHRSQMLVGLEFAGAYGQTFAHDLIRRGYRVVTVLPSVTKRFKEAEDNSPRKDDAKDAAQVCKLLGQGFFVGYVLLDELVAELRLLTTERQRLTREETGLKNRLQSVLDLAWPEFTTVFKRLTKATPQALLRRWPLAQDLAAASPRAAWGLMRRTSRGHVPYERAQHLLVLARTSVAVPTAADARRGEILRIFARWDALGDQMAAIDARLAELVEQHPAARALMTVPKIGALCAATLVAELGTPESFRSHKQVLKLAGMNLAGRESGTSVRGRIKQTKRGRPALRRQLFLLAGRLVQKNGGLYRPFYLELRERNGAKKVAAVCAVARKLVPVLLHIMQTGQPFDARRWHADHPVKAGAQLVAA